MASLVELNWNPDTRTLRQFGFVALGGFGALAACAWHEALIFGFGLGALRTPVTASLLGLGLLSLLLGLVYPRANRAIYLGTTLLAFPIGFLLSYVIMGVLYFLVIGPVGLGLRSLGHDPMQRRLDPKADSYWSPARPPREKSSYFRQF
ncbi:MAG: SxtJ family membrane protein [Myxococcales bacterium]|nr:SxtJ family membrane protein [Myxococcales bacterium]